jgi:hypothetical protein
MALNSNTSGYYCQKCKKDNEDFMIHCFSCDANFHASCIGVKGRMIDIINFDDGFHYYCLEHRKLSVSALLNKLSCMKKLNVQLISLMNQHKEALDFDPDSLLLGLEKRKEANLVESAPKRILRSATTSKPIQKLPKTNIKNTQSGSTSSTAKFVPEVSDTMNVIVEANETSATNQPIIQKSITDTASANSVPATKTAENIQRVEADAVTATNSSDQSAETLTSTLRSAYSDLDTESMSTLQAAPPNKKFILKGVFVQSTVEDVKKHISHKYGRCIDVHIIQMKLRDDCGHSTFLIFPGRNEELYKTLLEKDFWPKNTIVSEFDENFRKNKSNYRKRRSEHQETHQITTQD